MKPGGQVIKGPVVCKKQPPCLKGLLFKELDVFF